jgi:hypothetical protein
MACSKYTITNTGSTVVNFNYRRCDDSMWEYQVELLPNETKNIWTINNTYSTAFNANVELVNEGAFPPINATATPTPTPSVTPTFTPTSSVTPTVTPTSTLTPTPSVTANVTPTPTTSATPTLTPTPSVTANVTPTPTTTETPTPTPTLARFVFSSYFGSTSNDACDLFSGVTIYGDNALFDNNVRFYDSSVGSVTTDMTGFYSYGGQVVELDSDGLEVGGFSTCTLLPTPTTTTTPTATSAVTPTPTTSNTPTPTPTRSMYVYSLGYDASSASTACSNFSSSPVTVYAPVAGGPGPNIGESLYSDSGLSTPVSDGYYSNGTAWYEVTGGSGLVTSSDPNGC